MADKIKCVLLTNDSGKVAFVGELEREEALTEAKKLAAKGSHVEVFCPDIGRIFFDDGSMKAYHEAVAADKAKAAAKVAESKEAAKADRKKALKKELAELDGEAEEAAPVATAPKKTAKAKPIK